MTRVVTLSSLRQYWGALLPLLAVLGINGGFRSGGLVAVLAAVIVVALVGALVEWLRTWYGVHDGRLVVERGVLRRSLTVVPVDRIRGVDVHASALQRLLGIVSVRVDAAATGGREDEAVLNAVSTRRGRPAARRAAARGGARRARHDTARPSRPAGRPGCRRPRWCWPGSTRGGCSTHRWSAATCSPRWPRSARSPTTPASCGCRCRCGGGPRTRSAPSPAYGRSSSARSVVVLVAVAGAMVTAAVANWGFTLTRRGGTLVAERGLLSRRQVSLEHDRIRGYALAEPLALRAVAAARLTALVTGLGGGENENESGRRGQLLPLGPARVARAVAAAAVIRFDRPLRRHPPAARRRRLVRATLPWLVPAAVFGGFGIWPGLAACLALAGLGIPLALDRYAGLGNAVDERAVSVRSGSLRRRQVVLLRRGVVGATVRQTWFQRRAGLATVTLATGAGSGGYEAIDIGAADAVRLLRDVDPARVSALSTLTP